MHADAKDLRYDALAAFSLAVLIFSVARGAVPLLFGSAALARPTYTLSFTLGLLLSLYGLRSAVLRKNPGIARNLRLLLVVNLILNVIWWIPVVLLNPERNLVLSLAYTGFLPFAVLAYVRVPERRLAAALAIVTLLAAGTVIWDFIELNTAFIPGGYDLAVARQMLMRPETFIALGRTGELVRPVGILGGDRPHDSGNLLAMLSAYWTARTLGKGGSTLASSALAALAAAALLMTQSASNIAAFFVGLLFIVCAYRGRILRSALAAAATAAVLLLILAGFGVQSAMLWRWAERIGPGGAWQSMTALGITDPWMDLLAALIGHGSSLGLSKVGDVTEFGFLKILMESGLIAAGVFLALLFYPAWRYLRTKNPDKIHAVPCVAAVVVGFVSLWHYGSVLRTTNIFVFLALYAHALTDVTRAPGSRAPGIPPSRPQPRPN